MPARDGTGPMGFGELSRRGLGLCKNQFMRRCGYEFNRKYNQDCYRNANSSNIDYSLNKEFLTQKKGILEKRLDYINKQLEDL